MAYSIQNYALYDVVIKVSGLDTVESLSIAIYGYSGFGFV